jgi:ABC-type uncharacterized transport system permease subunit
MEFRAQFFAGLVAYIIWSAVSHAFIEVVFSQTAVMNWTRNRNVGALRHRFNAGIALLGAAGPNMWRFSSLVRDGGLDLALCRPINTQFLVSSRYIDPTAC